MAGYSKVKFLNKISLNYDWSSDSFPSFRIGIDRVPGYILDAINYEPLTKYDENDVDVFDSIDGGYPFGLSCPSLLDGRCFYSYYKNNSNNSSLTVEDITNFASLYKLYPSQTVLTGNSINMTKTINLFAKYPNIIDASMFTDITNYKTYSSNLCWCWRWRWRRTITK